jgi:LysM repeat protein
VAKGQNLTTIAQRYGTTVQALASLNNLRDAGSIRAGQVLKIPKTSTAPQEPSVHRVKRGQTLTAIAKQYNTTVQALASLNKINNPRGIRPGQLLKIPRG